MIISMLICCWRSTVSAGKDFLVYVYPLFALPKLFWRMGRGVCVCVLRGGVVDLSVTDLLLSAPVE